MKGLLLLVPAILFTGCCEKFCPPKILYKDRIVYVDKPIKCHVPPVTCSIEDNATDSEVVIDLVECVIDHKEAAKVCE